MKKLILIFSFIFLNACSNETYSIYGEISSIEEDSINVGCSDLVRKSNNSNDDIGYSCTIKITDETIIKTQAGDAFTFDELNINHMVSVYFEEPITSVDSERLTFEAKEITVFESKEYKGFEQRGTILNHFLQYTVPYFLTFDNSDYFSFVIKLYSISDFVIHYIKLN